LKLSAGKHNEVQAAIVELFAPQFAKNGEVIYLGDTAKKDLYVDKLALKKLGIPIDEHSKLPDVVIYDHLIHTSVLEHAQRAEKIYVGKQGGSSTSTRQETIQKAILKHVRTGKHVVRLKGGDPFVFGRGGEEALRLAKEGIAFEVIPGITSGIAVPAYAGIPVTHRGLASEVTFITAHEDPSKIAAKLNFQSSTRGN